MAIRNAVVRAVRTAAQALAAGLLALPIVTTVTEIVSLREALTVAVYQAGLAGVVSFLQNAAEDNSSVEVPK